MSIVSLFCEIHDFFMMYEAHLSTQSLPSQTPSENTRTSPTSTRQRGDDHPHRLPSKQLSDVETLL